MYVQIARRLTPRQPQRIGMATFVTVILMLTVRPAQAQLVTGTVTGSVNDPSGSIVVGAVIRLTNTSTNVSQQTTSDTSGDFRFLLLTPAVYALEASSPGFKGFRREGIIVEAARSLAVPVMLPVGQVTETVEVVGGTPLLEPNTSTLGSVVDLRKVEELPLNGRNPMGLANLIPTVRSIGWFGGQVVSSWRMAAVSIGGGAPTTNDFMIDGMANTKLGDAGGPMNFLAADNTQEFRVETNAMSAEFGRTGGGVMSIVSKAGTNKFHGSLFEYLRNDNLNANEFFANRNGQKIQPLAVNQFGGTFAGPLIREKLFFYSNYERFAERRSVQQIITTPTVLQRRGDFSQTRTQSGALIAIYDPYTTRANPANPAMFTREVFPGNVVPTHRLSPFALAVLDYFPLPNLPGLPDTQAENLFQQSGQPIDKNAFGIRVDYNLSQSRRMFVRYSWDDLDWQFPNFFHNEIDPEGRMVYVPRYGTVLGYTESISPTLLFDLKAGFNREFEHYDTPSNGFDLAKLHLPKILATYAPGPGADKGVFPRLTISDFSTVGGREAQYGPSVTATYSASLTKILRSHSLKSGFQYRQYFLNRSQTNNPTGTYNFNRGFTQGPNPLQASSTAGYGLATMLLGTASTGTITTPTVSALSLKNMALFFQDDWRVTRRLTLNLGLRWEYEGPPTDRFNQLSNFDASIPSPLQVPGLQLVGGIVYPDVNGISRGLTNQDFNDFGPRFGFAYQANSKTVVRGGYGILHIPTTGDHYTQREGFSRSTSMVTSIDGGLTPVDTMVNPFPNGILQPVGNSLGALTGIGNNITGQIRNLRRGYVQQWNFTLQHEPWNNWLLEAAWAANHGVHLYMSGVPFNEITPEVRALGNQLAQSVPNPFFGIIKEGTLSAATTTRQQLLRPYPHFTGVNSGYGFLGDNIYHALAVKVEKRFSNGFSALASYTVSKQLDTISSGTIRPGANASIGVQNWYDLAAERSKTANDIPQRLVVTNIWELPFGKTGHPLVRNIVGGWQINSIVTIESGPPLSLSATATGGANRPNVVPGLNAKLDNPTLQQWFDTAAFSQPVAYTLGNSSRTLPNVSADGVFNMDVSMFKTFRIKERYSLLFRTEAFNLTNSPTFAAPGSALNSATFGVITSTALNPKPREIQLGLVFRF